MAWRGLHLTRPARLALSDGQIVVAQDEGEVRLPLEDVAWIVLDTPQATLTTALISACMTAGIALVTCDATHTPSGVTLPFHTHYRQAGVAALQAAISAPLRKRLWQVIVQQKILNQAAILEICTGQPGALPAMARQVGSGDPDNVEARAARYYWSRLLPDFAREDGADRRNKVLNYGYAVARSGVARAVVAYGLLPAFGLHHASVTNAFNLADDLLEPFRPFVDRLCWKLSSEGDGAEGELSKEDRQALAGVLTTDALVGRNTVTLLVACEQAAASLVEAMERGDASALALPRLRTGLL